MNLRGSLEHYLNEVWYRRASPPWWLRMLTPVFKFFARRRHQRGLKQRQSSPALKVPVIVVGNITVGGSGKTPLVIGLIERLQQAGFRPGLISRGYRSQAERSGAVVLLGPDSTAAAVGDEPLMIYHRCNIPVAVAAERVAAARAIEDQVDLIISDDGLQHQALPRDLEIVVLDQQRKLGNGYLLPAGPLRETADRLNHVDFVLEHGQQPVSEAGRFRMHLQTENAHALAGGETRPLSNFAEQAVQVITGVAHPDRLIQALKAEGLMPQLHQLPDHHQFRDGELESLRQPGVPLLVTEKDAVKLNSRVVDNVWVVPAHTVLQPEFETQFEAKIQTLIHNHAS